MRPVVPRGKSPLLGAGIVLGVVIAALLVWLLFRSGPEIAATPAAEAAPGSALPVQPPTPAAAAAKAVTPTTPERAAPLPTVMPTAAPTEPATAPHAVAPHRSEPSEAPAQARPAPSPAAARPARGRPQPAAAPIDPDIANARAALRALEHQPVIKVKPSSDGPVLQLTPSHGDDNGPPAPPPAPGE